MDKEYDKQILKKRLTEAVLVKSVEDGKMGKHRYLRVKGLDMDS